jgi:hypothetical protein
MDCFCTQAGRIMCAASERDDALAEVELLREVMRRVQWHRDEALNAHDRADSDLKRQYYQGAAEALGAVLLGHDSTLAKTHSQESGE